MEGREEGVRTIFGGGGDFNDARTGEEGGMWGEEKEERVGRRSRDKKKNKEGRRLVEFIGEKRWFILNGRAKGDEEGNWTYSGTRGESVIAYVVIGEEMVKEIKRLEIGVE